MIIKRVVANANKWTFKCKPIGDIIKKYVRDGRGWVDPFAGFNSPAEYTNDLNKKAPAKFHFEAEYFCKHLEGEFKGVIFDPPYSPRQIKECYENIGLDNMYKNNSWYNNVKNAICDKIKPGGFVISCGWNSHGFGKNRGFEIIEILLVCHPGGEAHDTIVVVEKKVNEKLGNYEAGYFV